MSNEYDGIIIGAGHNGMICCGYLAKAGQKILVVERHLEMGGGLDAHEGQTAGFWHNVHSANHRGVCDTVWYKQLQLAEHGQEYIRLPVSVAMLLRDNRAILWYADEPEKTAESIGQFSTKDAKSFLEAKKKYADMAKEIFAVEQYSPPVPFKKKKALLERSSVGRQYLKWQPYSIMEVFSEIFEHDVVRTMFTFLSIVRGYEVDSKDLGFIAAAALGSGVETQMAKGTSHSLAHTLHKMIIRAGADVIDGVGVEKIMVEEGRAVGVRLADGRKFRAKNFIASSINPNMTFLDMIGPKQLDPQFTKKVENFKYSNTTPLFTLHLSLNEQLKWKAAEHHPDVEKSWYIVAGPESLSDVVQLYEDCEAGRIPRAINLVGGLPSQHDPTQAPPGKCTAFFWQVAPGSLSEEEGGKERWDQIRDEYTKRCADHLAYYAENLTPENIVESFGFTPLDIERHLPEMVGGDIQAGELSHSQILDKRPFPECSRYSTPIPGLYLCGASTHPSGNITGAPGYNAANAICQDLGLKPWWNPVDSEAHWKSLCEKEGIS